MSHPRPFRFGVALHEPLPGMSWADSARRVEDLGFATLVVPDHWAETAQLAPFSALAAAAAATSELRVGALVLGNDYRHPVTVAHETATLDVLSAGRAELGLGAGWKRVDYDTAGMAYDRPGLRIDRLEESIAVIRGLLGRGPFSCAGEHYTIDDLDLHPDPVQDPVPLLIGGGGGRRMLTLAAREADIVGVSANLAAGEIGPDAAADSLADAYDEKLDWVRSAAGDRYDDLELNVLSMITEVTDDRDRRAEEMAPLFASTPEAVLSSPAALVGDVAQMVETLEARRERWDVSYPVFNNVNDIDGIGRLVSDLRGR